MIPSGQKITFYYFKGLVNETLFNTSLIEPLVRRTERNDRSLVKEMKDVIYSSSIDQLDNWKPLIQHCLHGKVICHIEGLIPISISLKSQEGRDPNQPETEYQVYGPKAGFVEESLSNVAMLRQFIKDPRLKMKEFNIGSLSDTHVAMIYLDEYVDPDLCDLVQKRLGDIEIDNLVQAGQLENELVDYPLSIFAQVLQTERPERCSFALSQGKIVVVVNNSTMVLVLPITIMELYETNEEQYDMPWNTMFLLPIRTTG